MAVRELALSWAYGFADRVIEEIWSPQDCILDFLDPTDGEFVDKVTEPCKDTLLHDFIRNLHLFDFDYSTGHWAEESIDVYVSILDAASMPQPTWLSRDLVRGHIHELDDLLATAVGIITEATFHLLFSDRAFLVSFQELVARKIACISLADRPRSFMKEGVVRRTDRLPTWLRRAVFFRDKGRCQACFCDLTGVVALDPRVHLDHMRALARLGSNDPTNFQLLCETCNLQKGLRINDFVFRTFTYW